MFASFLIHVRPLCKLSMSRHTGRYINGLIYYLLKDVDPELATWVHEEASPKPFTISPLEGNLKLINGEWWAVPEEVYTLRCTTLQPLLFSSLGEALFKVCKNGAQISIDNTIMRVERLSVPPLSEPLTGQTTDSGLIAQSKDSNEITLEFHSPTAFKKGELHILFPQPRSVFGSLAKNWSAFATHPLHPDFSVDFLENQIAVSRHRLETKVIQGGKYKLLGFVGQCTYQVSKKADPEITKQLNTLADFAFYAGVGMKTTQGMGQTRKIQPSR